ncbi:enoyl-CoA hydratase/isomerase family protein [Aeromicrobium panaciterrae]|uniref:enoyl-CoA hydratase/isomerase family protein n=1 Tax=Aeromicrobium panaciterrae TaxID=363861 RepID=UPI0031DD7884
MTAQTPSRKPGVIAQQDGDTVTLFLNRPERHNALARYVHHDLGTAIDALRDEQGVCFVVLRGSGDTFSSGGDLDELRSGLPIDYLQDYWARMEASVLALRRLPHVVISAVSGAAVGAGAALALAADIVIAETDARWRFSFGHVGFVPDAGSTLSIARSGGGALARDLLLTGRWMSSEEAHRSGLIARLALPGELDRTVAQLLDELRQSPAISLAMTKDLIENLTNPDFAASVRTEGVYQSSIGTNAHHRAHLTQRFGRLDD